MINFYKKIKIVFLYLTIFVSINTQAQQVVIGTGTNFTSTTTPSPVCNWYRNYRMQILYTAAEINAMGIIGPHNILSLGWNVGAVPQYSLPSYEIKMLSTPMTNLSAGTFTTGAFTTVYTNTLQSFSVGWNTFTLATPYSWNGLDNILLEICWAQIPVYVASGSLQYTTSSNKFTYYQIDNSLACPVTTCYSNTDRPNCRFNFQVPYPPCAAQPTAGTPVITPNPACIGKTINLTATGGTLASQMQYIWQSAPANNPTSFTSLPGMPVSINNINTTFNAPAYYRYIEICPSVGLSDTSNAVFVDSAAFYFCYCNALIPPVTGNTYYIDSVGIGNTTLANGSSGITPTFYQTFAPVGNKTATLNQTGNYTMTVKRGPSSAIDLKAGFWIDFNKNGNYDASEFTLLTNSFGVPTIKSATFSVPNGLTPGNTGMRVIMTRSSSFTQNVPCATNFNYGEIEDYVVNIGYPPCTNPTNPGTNFCSDSAICKNIDFMLYNLGYSKLFNGITKQWEKSTDGLNYSPIPGATSDTIITNTNLPSWYRMGVRCNGGPPSYAPSVKVELFPDIGCYCPSGAINPSTTDFHDVGALKFGNFLNYSPGGPHLLNPDATRKYTSRLDYGPIVAKLDSSYNLGIYHIQRNDNHENAKVTVFIDFNRNGYYEAATEKVMSSISTATGYYTYNTVQIPSNAGQGITGMRLIINKDLNPNIPSDQGCGNYYNGETEDYVVLLKKDAPLSISNMPSINNLSVYPNPAKDNLSLYFEVIDKGEYEITIQNMIGQIVYSDLQNVKKDYYSTINLSDLSSGSYLVFIKNTKTNSTEQVKFNIAK